MRHATITPVARWSATVACLLGLTGGCGSRQSDSGHPPTTPPRTAVDPVEFPEGDPSVPAGLGGPGFTGEGWEPTEEVPLEGSPDAVRGGAVRYWVGTFPATLRIIGKDSTTTTNSLLEGMCYETLLGRHSDTMQFTPRLASHWQISEDKRTFRYRINPRAHWPDGRPVVAEDVVASWKLMMDESTLQPALQVVYGKFRPPRALSQYLVEVQCQDLNWRNFLYFSAALPIFAAHEIGTLGGSEFLETYQFRMPMGTGPYEIRDADVKKNESVTLRRRPAYWGWNERFTTGLYNFDVIRLMAGAEANYALAYEQLKKGELDIFLVGKAQDWVEDVPQLEAVRRGLLQARRIFNDEPMGIYGLACNTRIPPLDDVRVRKALGHLFHRKVMIEKLFYNEYTPLNSYFAGTDYANPGNEVIEFDLETAQQLLGEAGWTERGRDGVLVKDGRRLELELTYSNSVAERFLTVYQEDCRKVGVQLNLELINWATSYKAVHGDRNFQLYLQALTGLVDPNPETSWLSELADLKDNNNITGFQNSRVDELIRAYDRMFDIRERVPALREMDGIVYREHHYVLGWGADNKRLLYWNKFGHPAWYLPRTGSEDAVLSLWWVDPQADAQLKEARRDASVRLPRGPERVEYWRQREPAATPRQAAAPPAG